MSLPLHLRSYVEKTKDEANRDFFNVPPYEALAASGETQPNVVKQYAKAGDHQRDQLPVGMQPMEINAVLSVDGKDEVYVSSFVRSALACPMVSTGQHGAIVECRGRYRISTRRVESVGSTAILTRALSIKRSTVITFGMSSVKSSTRTR
jgi:hypothetical protein